MSAYEQVLRERGGTAAFLALGDPAHYDSTIGIVESLAERMPIEYDVLPGISAPQLLAARHRVPLQSNGQPVHVTSSRGLREALEAGQTNIVVMLNRVLDLGGLEHWSIWWGANLGTDAEELIAGRVEDVLDDILTARERIEQTAGWVMDIYLLRSP